MGTISETSRRTLCAPVFKLYKSQKKKTKRKGIRKHLRRLQLKTSLKLERNSHPSPGTPESPMEDKHIPPEKKIAKKHINQILKIKQKETHIKSNKGKSISIIQGNTHNVNT